MGRSTENPLLGSKVVPFFQGVTFPRDCTLVQKCYVELSKQVKEKLGPLDPYFQKLADEMVTWIEAWDELNTPAKAALVKNEEAPAKAN